MNILLEIGVFLVFILAVLLVFFFITVKKKKQQTHSKEQKKPISLLSLVDKVKVKTATESELQESLEKIIELYGSIDDFTLYEEVVFSITLHANTNKTLIFYFEKELAKRNPAYKKRISDAVMNALKLR